MELLIPRPGIRQIRPYPVIAAAEDAQDRIDLSLTMNPVGPSPKALAAYRQMATQIHRYPDVKQQQLRQAIARRYDIERDRIACSAGSEEMLHLVTQAFAGPGDEVLCHEYGYRGFLKAIRAAGASPVIAAEREMTVDVQAMIDRASEKTKICFLANPNNPTGTFIPVEAVQRLRAGLPAHTLLVLDSAYAEFCRDPAYGDGTEIVESSDNVLMVRTFSKMHGLAGLRIGWAYGPAKVIDALNQIRGPFNVGLAAQAAAVAALSDPLHEQATLDHTERWRSWLTAELKQLGLRVYPSVCNFILVRVPPDPLLGVQSVTEHLARQGILVKSVADYGLGDCLRITIGREEENLALVSALADIMS